LAFEIGILETLLHTDRARAAARREALKEETLPHPPLYEVRELPMDEQQFYEMVERVQLDFPFNGPIMNRILLDDAVNMALFKCLLL
jgi:hypothetical protein